MARFGFVKSFERVKESVRLLEGVAYNDAVCKALEELRPVLNELEFEVNRLKEEKRWVE